LAAAVFTGSVGAGFGWEPQAFSAISRNDTITMRIVRSISSLQPRFRRGSSAALHSCEISLGMADSKKPVVEDASSILDEEDEATLAAIDRGIKAADEGRVVPAEEVRQRMQQWLTKSSTPTKHSSI